ncbi:AbrB family transcriptional regulator [Chelativorans alearense]|uniref:AbrB family transcriptional regulator n=1 Tax=Chelativorans alearense TaxID=2681495 RepID=UPI0013D45AF2|nr:AbrB family transcriptional regulator [Chelativorans alearense]
MIAALRDKPGTHGFAVILVPAAIGGAIWSASGLPLGWLMGAALVTGAYAMTGRPVAVPKLPHRAGLVMIGSGVGLVLTPEIAARMTMWAPMMLLAAGLGIAMAALCAPLLARAGRVSVATAYFSLLPGGIIEMARVGEDFGADRTTIAALHTVRVGLVVGLLPLMLLGFLPHDDQAAIAGTPTAGALQMAGALAVGALGGWVSSKIGLPAAWLLGAVVAVGAVAATGAIGGQLHPVLVILAQIIVGLTLGARFERRRLASIPRAMAAGLATLALIMVAMAAFAALAGLLMPQDLPSLILAFSIGGMAEMVLTAKVLHQDIALVAAFQTVRGVTVNAVAGAVWQRLDRKFFKTDMRGE